MIKSIWSWLADEKNNRAINSLKIVAASIGGIALFVAGSALFQSASIKLLSSGGETSQEKAIAEIEKLEVDPLMDEKILEIEETTESKESTFSNLPLVRVYSGKINAFRIQSILNKLNVEVEVKAREQCLSGTPITAIWPDPTVDFGTFKDILLLLTDSGFKFIMFFQREDEHLT